MKLTRAEIEEQYLDVLQNIEAAITRVYREHPEMVDWDVSKAMDGLIRAYQAESIGRSTILPALKPLSREVFDSIKTVCEWRLGRIRLQAKGKKDEYVDMQMEPKTVDEIIACLKRINRSVEKFNRSGGQQGYLQFVSQFV